MRHHFRRDAGPRVSHRQLQVAIRLRRLHPDVATGRRVLARIGQEIRHDLTEARGVAVDVQSSRDFDVKPVRSLFEQRARHFEGTRHDVRDLESLALEIDTPASDSRHIEQVIHQTVEVPDLPFDDHALALGADVPPELHQL